MSNLAKDIVEFLCLVCEENKMKAALQLSGLGAMVAAAMALIGGLAGGPRGIAVGGMAGSLLGAWMVRGQFKPVSEILMELPPAEQQRLVNEATAIIRNFGRTYAVQLTALVMSNPNIRKELLSMVTTYITKNLNARIHYGD